MRNVVKLTIFCYNDSLETLIAPEGKILVVDDVDINLKVFCGLLKQTQFQIDTVSSGYKALEMIRSKKYDLIFLYHMMPQMDGLETFQAMNLAPLCEPSTFSFS